MKVKSIYWRNLGPFGNKLQQVDILENGGLIAIYGKNGSGKCLRKNTKLVVNIKDKEIEKKFLKFLKK